LYTIDNCPIYYYQRFTDIVLMLGRAMGKLLYNDKLLVGPTKL